MTSGDAVDRNTVRAGNTSLSSRFEDADADLEIYEALIDPGLGDARAAGGFGGPPMMMPPMMGGPGAGAGGGVSSGAGLGPTRGGAPTLGAAGMSAGSVGPAGGGGLGVPSVPSGGGGGGTPSMPAGGGLPGVPAVPGGTTAAAATDDTPGVELPADLGNTTVPKPGDNPTGAVPGVPDPAGTLPPTPIGDESGANGAVPPRKRPAGDDPHPDSASVSGEVVRDDSRTWTEFAELYRTAGTMLAKVKLTKSDFGHGDAALAGYTALQERVEGFLTQGEKTFREISGKLRRIADQYEQTEADNVGTAKTAAARR